MMADFFSQRLDEILVTWALKLQMRSLLHFQWVVLRFLLHPGRSRPSQESYLTECAIYFARFEGGGECRLHPAKARSLESLPVDQIWRASTIRGEVLSIIAITIRFLAAQVDRIQVNLMRLNQEQLYFNSACCLQYFHERWLALLEMHLLTKQVSANCVC